MNFMTLVVAAALVAGQGGDAVESTNANHPRVALETTKGRIVLELDAENFTGKLLRVPGREDIKLPIQEQLIVELYSR